MNLPEAVERLRAMNGKGVIRRECWGGAIMARHLRMLGIHLFLYSGGYRYGKGPYALDVTEIIADNWELLTEPPHTQYASMAMALAVAKGLDGQGIRRMYWPENWILIPTENGLKLHTDPEVSWEDWEKRETPDDKVATDWEVV